MSERVNHSSEWTSNYRTCIVWHVAWLYRNQKRKSGLGSFAFSFLTFCELYWAKEKTQQNWEWKIIYISILKTQIPPPICLIINKLENLDSPFLFISSCNNVQCNGPSLKAKLQCMSSKWNSQEEHVGEVLLLSKLGETRCSPSIWLA